MIEWILLTIAAFILSVVLVYFFSSKQHWLADFSNHRSLHEGSIPRSGGLAFFMAFFIVQLVTEYRGDVAFTLPFDLWMPLLILVLVSLLDDFRHIPAALRLLAHALIAAWSLFLITDALSVFEYVILLFLGVWSINLTNFMDGSDGLTASMAVIFFSFLVLLLLMLGATDQFAIYLLVLSVLLGFLLLNWPKASIFMGDAGSTGVGYLVWLSSVLSVLYAGLNPLVPFVLFSPFWVDATVTLSYRLFKREKVWQAHRKHCYQRLIRSGYSHLSLLLSEIVIMLFCGLIAVAIQLSESQTVWFVLLFGLFVFYTVVIAVIFRRTAILIEND